VLRLVLAVGLAWAAVSVPSVAAAPFEVPAQLRLVSYYPARNGWTYMWARWDPARIDHDFGVIAGLDADAVRVIVQPDGVGWPRPTATGRERLAAVVSLAAAHGLAVELTLFDWWHDYAQIQSSKRWVRLLLHGYAGDQRVAAVELQNELDASDRRAAAWARALLPYLRSILPGTPVTISARASGGARQLALLKRELGTSQPDFWSFHYYDKPELAYPRFAAAIAAVAPTPIFVGETGYEAADSYPPAHGSGDLEDEQLRYFCTVAAAAAMLGLPPVAPWILYDFSPAATPVQMKPPEYHFGLFRLDGTAKPAADAVRAAFAGAPIVDPLGNGGFEDGAAEPALWRHSGAAVFARDTSVFRSGAASASIGAVPGTATRLARLTSIPPTPWVSAGQTLTLSASARAEALTGTTTISIRFYDRRSRLIQQVDSTPLPPGTYDWAPVSVQAVTPAGGSYIQIVVGSDGNTGRVWFDDLSLERG
jgi:hypothetical protein